MRASKTPILLVSPMSSSLSYEAILRRNNFLNISRCGDAVSALQFLEKNPAHVVISEVEMKDMDGFEFASHLREIERTETRYSYIILIAGQGVYNKVHMSWQSKVDAVVSREALPVRLMPQVMSGERIATAMNHLMRENHDLRIRCDQLEVGQLLDPLTGLGNRQQAIRAMQDMIRQIEARGGAIALLSVSIRNLTQLEQTHGAEVMNEVLVGLADKIKRLVRPLDVVTYFGNGLFAVVMQHSRLQDCSPSSYQRIYEGVALKHYPTRGGFIHPEISIGVCGASAEYGPPKIERLIDEALSNLEHSASHDDVTVTVLNDLTDLADETIAASVTS